MRVKSAIRRGKFNLQSNCHFSLFGSNVCFIKCVVKLIHICSHIQMRIVHASAPGKNIILGEHSVVHGKPALCGSIDSKRHHCWIVGRNRFIVISRDIPKAQPLPSE